MRRRRRCYKNVEVADILHFYRPEQCGLWIDHEGLCMPYHDVIAEFAIVASSEHRFPSLTAIYDYVKMQYDARVLDL